MLWRGQQRECHVRRRAKASKRVAVGAEMRVGELCGLPSCMPP
jgi:hypothetical protein